jgi:hypothetical protein
MKRMLFPIPLMMFLLLPRASADINGAWTLEWKPNFGGQDQTHECKLKQDDRKLEIDCEGFVMSGEVNGRKVTFQHQTGKNNELTAVYSAELDEKATTMVGTWRLLPEKREGKFEGRKHESK